MDFSLPFRILFAASPPSAPAPAASCWRRKSRIRPQASLGVLDATVERNAYGRQIDSSIQTGETTLPGGPLEMVYIRAPRIVKTGEDVQVLAHRDGFPVLVEQGHIMAATFHPELSADRRVHQRFVDLVRSGRLAACSQGLVAGSLRKLLHRVGYRQPAAGFSMNWLPPNGALDGVTLDHLLRWNLASDVLAVRGRAGVAGRGASLAPATLGRATRQGIRGPSR